MMYVVINCLLIASIVNIAYFFYNSPVAHDAGRRYYDTQFEPRPPPSPQGSGGHRQPSPGPIQHGRSAVDLLRPAYLPGTSDNDRPVFAYRPKPVPFGYERAVDDKPVGTGI